MLNQLIKGAVLKMKQMILQHTLSDRPPFI